MNNLQNFSDEDLSFMKEAISLAKNGFYTTLPNPCVGCVLVKNGKVIGRGYHKQTGTPHAEVWALRNAEELGNDVEGATAYVTLEPCAHQGLTPSCARTLVSKKVSRVVCAVIDNNPLVGGKGVKILQDAGISVQVGLLAQESLDINVPFFYSMQNNKPYVTVKLGMSLDAKLALYNGESKWITNSLSRAEVQKLRAYNQALISSADTVIADDPGFDVRLDEFNKGFDNPLLSEITDLIKSPLKVIIDNKDQVSLSSKIFTTRGDVLLVKLSTPGHTHRTIVDISNQVYLANDNITSLQAKVLYLDPIPQTQHVDLNDVLDVLNEMRIRNVLVESGGRLVDSFIKQNLVNEFKIFVAPKLMGSDSQNAFKVYGYTNMEQVKSMTLKEVKVLDNDVMLSYIVAK